MKPSDFVHLRCHSTYSLLEALPSPGEIVQRAKEIGSSAVGLADTGHVHGLVEFVLACRTHGLKPILGCEMPFTVRSRLEKDPQGSDGGYPMVLLAENDEGYGHLLSLVTRSALESASGEPRADFDLLREYGRGLLVLSGPIEGLIPQAALREDGKEIRRLAEAIRSCVGDGNLYFELMDIPTLPGQEEVNQQLREWGTTLGVPVVATVPCRYCRREDAEAHDALLCIQRNALLHDPARFSLLVHDLSMRPMEALHRAFSHLPEAIANTRAIAERCSVTLDLGRIHIPRFPVPAGATEASVLHDLCEQGVCRRYPRVTKAIRERLDYELTVIAQMGFSGYFLIVADFVAEAKRRGITVGPGRGSAAGSIVSYCLDITTLDPLAHGLLFERFLNPERISLPDIDLDFADTRRDEILAYVAEKYGRDHVAQICTFGTLAARAAVKDVGRAHGVSFVEMNDFAKLIPDRPGTELQQALEASPELRLAVEANDTYRQIFETARKLEGKARHVSIHACGVIITPEPITTHTALQRAPKDDTAIITQYDARSLEALGLLKMDFLGLTNLTVIQTALQIIERLTGETIDMARVSLDDPATYRLLSSGETTGVFQLESVGMRRYLRELQPSRFGDIVAMVALYRPGPMEWISHYIRRKHGGEEVTYLHPDLKGILEETYGIGVYQEQILQLAQLFAGYTLGEADLLRKAIGKKIKEEMDRHRSTFVAGAAKKGYDRRLAGQIFEQVVLPFAGYGFPKAHAASYARIAFETAYLKAHHPVAFMAALLSSDAQNTDRVSLEIAECRAMGIDVLPPDINESLAHFTVVPSAEGGGQQRVRFGLTAIKGLGESSVREILRVRSSLPGGVFTSLEQFARCVPSKLLNKKLLEALAKSGALDGFCGEPGRTIGDRGTFVEHYDRIVDFSRDAGDVGVGQVDLFAGAGQAIAEAAIEFPHTEPATAHQKLQWEKETLGLFVSSHPLAGLRSYIGRKAQLISSLTRADVGRRVTVAGLEDGVKKITTRQKETMAVLTLEDPTGKIEATLFPRTYAKFSDCLGKSDTLLVVNGTLEARNGQLQVRADVMKRASLSTLTQRAREEGLFDSAEARRGVSPRRPLSVREEVREVLDEEGNIVVVQSDAAGEGGEELGILGAWIQEGMATEGPLGQLGLSAGNGVSEDGGDGENRRGDPQEENTPPLVARAPPSGSPRASLPRISLHTVDLPREAPKQLLLDLKKLFQRFPGRERVQLRIGDTHLELPLTVTMSTILEKKVEDLLAKYKVKA